MIDSLSAIVITDRTSQRITSFLTYLVITLFFVSIALLVYYQIGYVLATHAPLSFTEPDNYEYMLFAQEAVAHHTLNASSLTNPYLLHDTHVGFFEHPGLVLMPVYLYDISNIPLLWDFRILQLCATILLYAITLLLARHILLRLPLSRLYRYFGYTMVMSAFLLMQYTQITEWRGNEFAAAITLAAVCLVAYLFTNLRKPLAVAGSIIGIFALAWLSMWIWSGGFITVIVIVACVVGMLLYRHVLQHHVMFWRYFAAALVIFAIILYFGYAQIEYIVYSITSYISPGVLPYCAINPLHLGELECLTPQNGMLSILMMLIFGALAMIALMGKTIMSNEKRSYEYFMVGIISSAIVLLPLSLIYIRMLSTLAPYFTLLYVLGVVSLLSYFRKVGSNRIVMMLTMVLILLAGFVGQYLFWQANIILYNESNPLGLIQASEYLMARPNAPVLTYFGYGDFLEQYAHVMVYADTIEGLNVSMIQRMDNVFLATPQHACMLLATLTPQPRYIMIGGSMQDSTLLYNASNESILKDPMSFSHACGYILVYNESGFDIFEKNV